MAYYLGIDGGGTKTRCVLSDETRVLARAESGGSNIVRLGEARVREALQTAILQVCSMSRVAEGQIVGVCIGAAGAARPEIAAKIAGILLELIPAIPSDRIEIVGDSIIALESAFGEGPGVIAIAGTGSIAYGRDAEGRTARAGGWGFAVSDEGSGYWIGRRAISCVLSARDQGLETALTGKILQAWKLNGIDELVRHANSTPPPDFPRLFAIVLRAANGGDIVARELLDDAGARLAALAAIVVRRLAADAVSDATPPRATLPVAMTGSVFRQSLQVRRIFCTALQQSLPGIDVRPDIAEPVEGAVARAKRMKTGAGIV
jgi:glucosamine kinase